MDENVKYDVCIIGSGPAGLTAAIYAARAGRSTAIFAGSMPLGQLTYTTLVENYPGFAEPIMGIQLMENMKQQALNVGVIFIQEQVDKLEQVAGGFRLTVGEQRYTGKSCVVSTGSATKWLGLDSETKFQGYGVSSCATCDGFFYKGKHVLVVGGGNTAVEEAIYLSVIAEKVTLIHRRDQLRADKILQDRLLEKDNVEILWNSEAHEILGTDDPKSVTGVLLYNNKTEELSKLDVDGVFIAIGHTPQVELVKDLIGLADNGYVKSKIKTKVEGLFVAGDLADSVYRQAITAAADGCKAAMEATRFLDEKPKKVDKTADKELLDRLLGRGSAGRSFRLGSDMRRSSGMKRADSRDGSEGRSRFRRSSDSSETRSFDTTSSETQDSGGFSSSRSGSRSDFGGRAERSDGSGFGRRSRDGAGSRSEDGTGADRPRDGESGGRDSFRRGRSETRSFGRSGGSGRSFSRSGSGFGSGGRSFDRGPRPEGSTFERRPRPEGSTFERRPRPEGGTFERRPRPEGGTFERRPRRDFGPSRDSSESGGRFRRSFGDKQSDGPRKRFSDGGRSSRPSSGGRFGDRPRSGGSGGSRDKPRSRDGFKPSSESRARSRAS